MLPGQLRRLRDTATSEAKRLRHAEVRIPHLVLALTREFPEAAGALWGGEPDPARMEDLLVGTKAADRPEGEEAEVTEFFERVSPVEGDLLLGVSAYLAPLVGLDPPTPALKAGGPSLSGSELETRAKAPRERTPFDAAAAAEALRSRVLGQDHAIESIVDRLLLTTLDLDSRPHRPNGVFLLAGPTGVGKTEMAKALADFLDPSGESFIRLDMSEYQQQKMSVSRLLGSSAGYIGHGNKESLITTRVVKQPHAVILLDEVEKADPDVWTVFLQVFDDGRLTDATGQTADFRDTVILLTTNLGSASFNPHPVGIRPSSSTDRPTNPAGEVVAQIRKILPPELFNRLDETIVFNPLGIDEIVSITEQVVAESLTRLAASGIDCTVDAEVIPYLARLDYDPTLGARPVQRTIEREVLTVAARKGPGTHQVSLVDNALVWT